MKDKLTNKVIVFDDCNTFDGDLKNAIVNDAKAQKFVGGVNIIHMGPADKAAVCFWHMAMEGKNMSKSLPFCQDQYIYLQLSKFGIAGNGPNIFDIAHPHVLTESPWGGIAWDNEKKVAGFSYNNLSGDDYKDADAAKKDAINHCITNGGRSALCSLIQDHAQFQNCGAMYMDTYPDSDEYGTLYMVFGSSAQIAQANAKRECKVKTPPWGDYCIQIQAPICSSE